MPRDNMRNFVHQLNTHYMAKKKLKLIEQDPWLEPSEKDIQERYDRYEAKLKEIEKDFGGLSEIANGYKYFGINYDPKRKGWIYREWAPQAKALYLVGDFNNWQQFDHPLTKNEYGIWELFLPEDAYKNTFASRQ